MTIAGAAIIIIIVEGNYHCLATCKQVQFNDLNVLLVVNKK